MKRTIVNAWRRLSLSQSLALLGLLALLGVIVWRAPEGVWAALAEKDPVTLATEIALAIVAVAGVFAQGRRGGGAGALLLVLALPLVAGCGGASAAVRASYAAETARCVANERAIVDREGTTLEEDQDALAAERARCDAALAAIEGGGQ
jgi:hypothetical protein